MIVTKRTGPTQSGADTGRIQSSPYVGMGMTVCEGDKATRPFPMK